MIRLLSALVLFFLCLPLEAKPLDDANVESFKKAFNVASDSLRVVALLSPT